MEKATPCPPAWSLSGLVIGDLGGAAAGSKDTTAAFAGPLEGMLEGCWGRGKCWANTGEGGRMSAVRCMALGLAIGCGELGDGDPW